MNPVLMVIAHVVPKQAQKMTLVQGNHMIQELTAEAFYPTLGSSILPKALARWFVWVSIRSPAGMSSWNRRTSRLDLRSHSDRSRLPETHSVVVAQPSPPMG